MNYQPRQIKFRVWDNRRKEMIYEDNFLVANFNPFRITRKDNRVVLGMVMQFTGLKDKVGMAIYEGDVLLSASGKEKYKVIWHHSGWFEKSITGHQEIISLYVASKRQIVIGNIFAHPELIKT